MLFAARGNELGFRSGIGQYEFSFKRKGLLLFIFFQTSYFGCNLLPQALIKTALKHAQSWDCVFLSHVQPSLALCCCSHDIMVPFPSWDEGWMGWVDFGAVSLSRLISQLECVS